MNDEQRKEQIKKTFDTVAEGYGKNGMEFFHRAAACLPEIFRFNGDEQVLDVATGTGIAAKALAPNLPNGKITGVDFSDGMLQQARINLHQLDNIDLHQADMTAMPFSNHQFDAANCSFGIFFVEDMINLVRHIASKVKTGGHIVTCSFQPESFRPAVDLFLSRIELYGVQPPPISWKRICTDEQYRELYDLAGLKNITIHKYDVGYDLKSADQWWDIVWNAGFRGLVAQLTDTQLQQFKREHLAEVNECGTSNGIPLRVGVIFAEAIA